MQFNDSMRRLLRLRLSLERQEEMKLALASARLQRAQTGLDDARQDNRDRHQGLLDRLQGDSAGVSGSELQAVQWQHEAAAARDQRLQTDIATRQGEQQEQRRVLLRRTRERETLDTLRRHHLEAERRDQLRREQARLDEVFLLHRRDGADDDGPPD